MAHKNENEGLHPPRGKKCPINNDNVNVNGIFMDILKHT